ncbi:MAG: DUF2671 domain-containing protein [Rickettsiales bacterium]|jgi:hypothetical protein|nr:DUF2671 domain-containing protein [Rickettsiales bacterium]
MLLKDIESYIENNIDKSEHDLMSDVKYVCKSCSLITESLQKGCDVMQMPNGDIIITELKAVTFHYTWDAKKSALVRSQSGNKIKKGKPKKVTNTYKEEAVKTEELA